MKQTQSEGVDNPLDSCNDSVIALKINYTRKSGRNLSATPSLERIVKNDPKLSDKTNIIQYVTPKPRERFLRKIEDSNNTPIVFMSENRKRSSSINYTDEHKWGEDNRLQNSFISSTGRRTGNVTVQSVEKKPSYIGSRKSDKIRNMKERQRPLEETTYKEDEFKSKLNAVPLGADKENLTKKPSSERKEGSKE